MRNPRVSIIRGVITLTGVAIGLIITAGAAFASPGNSPESSEDDGSGDSTEITVTFDCTTAHVTSTKDISHVDIAFSDGSHEKQDGRSGHVGSFSGTGDNSGKTIATIWVKSGNNRSGDGSGFGQRFDSDAECTAQSPTAPEPSTDGGKDQENGQNDEPERLDIGTAVVIERPGRFIAANPATPNSVLGDSAVPAPHAASALAAPPSASMPAVSPVPAPRRQSEVLGVQVFRSTLTGDARAELARTGLSNAVLGSLGGAVTMVGAVMVAASKRCARR